MDFGGPVFVIAIVAISTLGWVITTAIRARHGYPLDGEWGGTVHKMLAGEDDDSRTKALTAENDQLKTKVGQLEERLKVLERIATDPSRQLANEIDRLR
jgi:hypothetical protein